LLVSTESILFAQRRHARAAHLKGKCITLLYINIRLSILLHVSHRRRAPLSIKDRLLAMTD